MISLGHDFHVWSVSHLIGEENIGRVRVILKREDCGDVTIECDIEDAPVIGSYVRLGWEASQ